MEKKGTPSSPELNEDLIISDIREYDSQEKFAEILSALESGRKVFIRTTNNNIYNKKRLRASQKAIRQKAAEEALFGVGHPATPVAKLVRAETNGKKPQGLAIVLNGHHRTAVKLMNRKGIELEVLLAEDQIVNKTAIRQGLDFDKPATMDEYGLKTDPRKINFGYGFNIIMQKMRKWRLTGDIERVRKADPVNRIGASKV